MTDKKSGKFEQKTLYTVERSTVQHLRTSIGRGPNSRPTNKNKKRGFKRYRGQGK